MGRRARRRPDPPVAGEPAPAPPPLGPTPRRRPGQSRFDRVVERADARPKPPWHPVPLVELSVLVGLVLLVVGTINRDGPRGRMAIVLGLALASLAGLDTAAREHFAGFRSHSTLLAGLPAVVAMTVLGLGGARLPVLLPAGALVFAAAFWAARRAFRARAGVAFKV